MIKILWKFFKKLSMKPTYLSKEYYAQFASKLGIVTPDEKDKRLIDDLLTILAEKLQILLTFSQKLQMTRAFQFMMKTAYLTWEKNGKIV